jgi:HAD superfamily hydrolase (TIGR01509 family)
MIQAIIFDCFGVLTTDGWIPFKEQYFGKNQELFNQATELNQHTNAGLITYPEFIKEIAELAEVSEQEANRTIENNVANKPLFSWIAELKKNYKIGVLSNAADNWLDELFEPTQTALFDAVALSYDNGFIKPDPRAYEDIADRLNVPIEACVMIDDQERFCTAAVEAGMKAIWYKDVAQCQVEFDKLVNASS